jgi:hypothetical protein
LDHVARWRNVRPLAPGVVELAVRRLRRWDSNAHRAGPSRSGLVRNPQLSGWMGPGRRPFWVRSSGHIRGRP